MYLMSMKDGQRSYVTVTPEEQKKISSLHQERKLPKTFNLHGTQVVTDDIIGFTEQAVYPQSTPEPVASEESSQYQSWDAIAAEMRAKPWYQRSRQASRNGRFPSAQ